MTPIQTIVLPTLLQAVLIAARGLDCNFENGFCGWKHNVWLRNRGSTGSAFTGPTHDHTSGNGYYAYLDASDGAFSGRTATLLSPYVNVPAGTKACLRFWYHMYGSDINTLTAERVEGGSLSTILWSLSGDQGNKWQKAAVTLQPGNDLRFKLVATSSFGFSGDIAIDDISFSSGACVPDLTCNFENDFCDWNNDQSSKKWTRKRDHADHTTGNGYYAYMDPFFAGTSRMTSPEMELTNDYCFRFWYYIEDKRDTLKVYRIQGGRRSTIWQLQGDKGPNWYLASMTLSPGSIKLMMEGLGESAFGGISIDDITINNGTCQYDTNLGR